MESLNSLRTKTTVELVNLLDYMAKLDDEQYQQDMNAIAYELACRIYVPGKGTDFDELVKSFGYKVEEEPIKKLKK